MKYQNRNAYKKGLKDAIPIAAGYLAVSFTLGIAAKKSGIGAFHATLMSLTNNTSAGQFAAFGIIAAMAPYTQLALSQLVINIRYLLMSFALSQKLDPKESIWKRMLLAYGVTDEIFGISVSVEGRLNPYYTYGAISAAAPCWALGTLLGVLVGDVLPVSVLNALGVALYAMFLAIIIPHAKKEKTIAGLVVCSMLVSLLCSWIPGIKELSAGTRVILLTVIISFLAAVLFPIEERKETDKIVESDERKEQSHES